MTIFPRQRILAGATILAASAALPMTSATAATAATEQRARIVESSLRDLSAGNEAAMARHRLQAGPELDALADRRVVLRPESVPDADALVGQQVQSSLHRLRRETVDRQTDDGRKARIEDSLDRASAPER